MKFIGGGGGGGGGQNTRHWTCGPGRVTCIYICTHDAMQVYM